MGYSEASFRGSPGYTYTFQVRIRDKAGNQSNWVQSSVVAVSKVTKYYTFGSQRVALRQGNQVYYLHGDHLGSTSLTTDQNGALVSQARYLPFGQERWTDGASPTDFTFTAQRSDSFGLMDYNARYYSPYLNRFVSPDTIIPNPANPQSLNRYAYAYNNPLKYRDPSGHIVETIWDVANIAIGVGSLSYNLYEGNYVDAAIDVGGLVVDVAATAIPIVPGGAGVAIKAYRAGDKAADLLEFATKADEVMDVATKSDEVVGLADEAAGLADEAAEAADEILYRGLYNDHPQLDIYKNTGIVEPWGGSATLEEHVNNGITQSNFTSWTTNRNFAADVAESDGTILTINRSEVPNNVYDSYQWSRFPNEAERTIEGPIHGAREVDPKLWR